MSALMVFKRGASSELSTLPVENGSLIVTTDTNELYTDINTSRVFIGQVQVVSTLPTSGISSNRIYFLESDNTFYKYINSTWVNVTNKIMTGATSSTDGKSGMVPAPTKHDVNSFLRGDGTWATPESITYSVATSGKDGLMSAGDKTKLDGIASGAEVNQNAFSKLTIGSTTINADTEEDSLSFVNGNNINLDVDVSNKKVTISATVPEYDEVTTSKSGLMSAGDKTKLDGIASGAEVNQNAFSRLMVGTTTISADTVTDGFTVVAGGNITLTPDASGKKLTIAATDTTYTNATTSKAGLMSTDDKIKLGGIETGANKTVVDTELNTTSTNPVQNKVIKSEIDKTNARIDNITNGADEALDSFKEFKEYLDEHQTEYEALQAIAENKVDKVTGKGLSTNDYTTEEKDKLSYISAGAEVNQNAFSKLTVGTTSITANAKTDTLTVVAGGNITLTPDASGKKLTIAATDTTYTDATTTKTGLMSAVDKTKLDSIAEGANNYTHPTHTSKSSGFYKVTVDGSGHVSAATAVTKADITELGIPAQDTTYANATTSKAGLMSADDKAKLDNIGTDYATDEEIETMFKDKQIISA